MQDSVSTVEQVIAVVKAGVKQSRYAPGQRIVESELMQELSVSRGSVREALRRLAAEGLVEWERFKSASIVRMSRRQVEHLVELRELLEGHAARLSAERMDAGELKTISRLQRTKNAKSLIPSLYDEYNNTFHTIILNACGNDELPKILERVRLPIIRLQFNHFLLQPDKIRISCADHARVSEAILRNDGPAAERAMRRHIRNMGNCIMEAPSTYFA